MMRSRFDEQLQQLNTELIQMGALCETAIASAAKALLENDLELAAHAVEVDREIDEKEHEIETLCLKLILKQQPVARDLRLISAALKMITDMERIGDQASDIAEIVTMAHINASDSPLHIGQMAEATIYMVTKSIDAFVKRDLDLARAVIAYDDVVDDFFDRVKSELISLIGAHPERGEYAIDLLMIAKYFERIGDHATNIAEWVEFAMTGRHKGEEKA
jgi:phosphate transport system protein